MAKKMYAVLNNIFHGVGMRHRMMRPGDTIELDPAGEERETVLELLAKDYIEDPENPKERTPEERMHIEQRQIAGRALAAPTAGAVRRELADMRRVDRLETLLAEGVELTPEQEAEARAIARSKAEDESTLQAARLREERASAKGKA